MNVILTRVLALLTVVSFVMVAELAPAQGPARTQSLAEIDRETRRAMGEQCLAGQDWQRAGEIFGTLPYELPQAVDRAWRGNRGRNELEQARYQFALVNFLFWHNNFDLSTRTDALVRRYAADYSGLVAKLPKPEHKDALDFTHLELLDAVADAFWRQGRKVTAEQEAKVLAALKQNPDSIPALAAFHLVMQMPGVQQRQDFWKTAEALHTGRLGKLYLARAVNIRFRHSRDFDLETAERVLAAAWELAPSNEHKAGLLLGLADVQAKRAKAHNDEAGRRLALSAAVKVFENYPATQGAAGARTLAIHIHLYGGRLAHADEFEAQPAEAPTRALAFLRQLQARGPGEQGGLDQALLDVAWNQQVKKQLDQAAELLQELLDKYPDSSLAFQAMLRLAEIHALKGDAVKQREWLERSTGAKQEGRFHTSTEANRRLAVFHEERKEWKDALAQWQAWKPSSTCGTCLAGMRATRAEHIAFCQRQLGDHSAAVRTLWEAMHVAGQEVSGHLAFPLYELYAEARQLDDLWRAVGRSEEAQLKRWEANPVFAGRREEIRRYLTMNSLAELRRLTEQVAKENPAKFQEKQGRDLLDHVVTGEASDVNKRYRGWRARWVQGAAAPPRPPIPTQNSLPKDLPIPPGDRPDL